MFWGLLAIQQGYGCVLSVSHVPFYNASSALATPFCLPPPLVWLWFPCGVPNLATWAPGEAFSASIRLPFLVLCVFLCFHRVSLLTQWYVIFSAFCTFLGCFNPLSILWLEHCEKGRALPWWPMSSVQSSAPLPFLYAMHPGFCSFKTRWDLRACAIAPICLPRSWGHQTSGASAGRYKYLLSQLRRAESRGTCAWRFIATFG